jgi:hypothetical protein
MIAIETKYLSPTNTRGSKIKAFTCNGHSVTVSYDHALSNEAVHFEAVKELVKKYNLDWNISSMVYGGTKAGYVFCFPNSTIEA